MQHPHICNICGKTFSRKYKSKENSPTYCSRSCANKAHSLRMQGENNSNYRSAKVTRNCKTCGKEVVSYTSFGNKKFYCSKECRNKGRSIKLTGLQIGEKNPMFGKVGELAPFFGRHHSNESRRKLSLIKGGTGIPGENVKYPRVFKNIKLQIRSRDNFCCQLCAKTESENFLDYNQKLSVHHIDYNKENCNESNLISLCSSCHGKTNTNREYWQNLLQKAMSGESLKISNVESSL